jgi:predicted GIY-YIG superfamily endonuclease
MARPFFAYMLLCSDKSYYVGHTDDLERRLAEHETGATGGYTFTRRPIQLVWFEECPTREEAKLVEAQLKKWSRSKKEALIEGKMDELKEAARKDWFLYDSGEQRNPRPSLPRYGLRPTRDNRSCNSDCPE